MGNRRGMAADWSLTARNDGGIFDPAKWFDQRTSFNTIGRYGLTVRKLLKSECPGTWGRGTVLGGVVYISDLHLKAYTRTLINPKIARKAGSIDCGKVADAHCDSSLSRGQLPVVNSKAK
jgi:hypothetical protein